MAVSHISSENTPQVKVITIDGPAGSGKSTAARHTAERLGWTYVTTGAIYRTLGLIFLESGEDFKQEVSAERFIGFLSERYRQDSRSGRVFLGDRDVSQDIRTPKISEMASIVAQNAYIRKKLLPLQRRVVQQHNGAVVDGRDMGTVVFPDAKLKIYLHASAEERARRRLKELQAQGENLDLCELVKEIDERDKRDAGRDCAPMVAAQDAVRIDSTQLSMSEVIDAILKLCSERGLIPS